MKRLLLLMICLLLGGCVGIPEGVEPVQGFEAYRYLGTWYEIARLDHPFERGLNRVRARYVMREDGTLRVMNTGFSSKTGRWESVEGRARFVTSRDTGFLKVSFFGPFYSSYVIFEVLEDNYQHAYVSGHNKDYLWLLSRTPRVSEDVITRFKEKAGALGFNVDELIIVKH